jgi:hypothetical protein
MRERTTFSTLHPAGRIYDGNLRAIADSTALKQK